MKNLRLWSAMADFDDSPVILGRNRICLGDNLDWLQSETMQSLHNQVKVIYIDPPYNTRTAKSYKDSYQSSRWIEELKSRIEASQAFLHESGVLFISIDDNEYARLKISCDDIFGDENFIGTFITRQAQRSNSKLINITHEYILAYAKNKEAVQPFSILRTDIPEQREMIDALSSTIQQEFHVRGRDAALKKLGSEIKRICQEMNITWLKNYNCLDDTGKIFFGKDLSTPGTPREVHIPEIGLHLQPLKTRSWSSDEKFITLYQQKRLAYKGTRPYEIHYLHEARDSAPSILNFYSRQGSNDLNKLGLRDLFDTPKPVELIKFLIRLVAKQDDMVMDFYAGSGTTAQAVYEINQEDQKNLGYVLMQRKEAVNPKSKAYDTCIKLNIEPYVSDILLHRINVWLQRNKHEVDYVISK